MKTISIKLNQKEIKELETKTRLWKKRTDIQYTLFQVKNEDVTITVYSSGKAVFSGEDLTLYVDQKYLSDPNKGTSISKNKINENNNNNNSNNNLSTSIKGQSMSGSDEVGTGDYFGPVVVCAAIVNEADLKNIPVELIADTKELKDDLVRTLGPILKKELKHSLLILDNRKYNKVQEHNNMNAIKAKLHNQAFLHLEAKYVLPKYNIIDQFCTPKLYYRYLKDEEKQFKDLYFETKAENKFIAVACAAIIARYAFLDYFDQLSEKYDFVFPKGAGKSVDIKGKEFVKLHGKDALRDVAKLNFINTQRIINQD